MTVIPMTRAILVKGNTLPQVMPELWSISLFFAAAVLLSVLRFHRTLD